MKYLCALIAFFLIIPWAHAGVYVKRFPTDTPVLVYPAPATPPTNGNCAKFDASGNPIDSGSPCGGSASAAGGKNAVQYNSGAATFSGDETKFSFNGTNIGIGTTNGTAALDVRVIPNFTTNVGIGSLSPGKTLDVQGTGRLSSTLTTVGISNTAAAITNDNAYTQSGTSSDTFTGTSTFSNATNSAFFTGGKVGIGTISPGSSLSILNNLSVGSYATNAGPVGGAIFSGNIGIGQTTAGDQLDITGTNISAGMTVTSTASTGYAYHEMVGSGGNLIDVDAYGATKSGTTLNQSNNNLLTIFSSGGTLAIGPLDAQPIVMGNNNNEYFRIAAAGNVGIQTANPGAGLDINGSERIRGTNSLFLGNDNKASIAASSTTTPDITFLTNSAEIMRITNGGNVGIGSASPGTKLDVQGTGRFSSTLTASNLSGTNTGDQSGANPTASVSTSAVNGVATTFMRSDGAPAIDQAMTPTWTGLHTFNKTPISILTASGGNVGIGTPTPGAMALDVAGTTRQTGFVLTGNGAASGFILQASGAQGIGTWVPSPSGGGGSGTVNSGTVNQMARYASSTTAVSGSTLVYDDLTNIGIGTVVPQSKLDVVGSDTGITITNASAAMHSVINTNTTVNNFEDVAFGTGTSTGVVKIGAKIAGVNVAHTNGAETLDMAFLTTVSGTSSENMRIIGGGNIGIGTTKSGAKLAVIGNVGIGTWATTDATATHAKLEITGDGNTELFRANFSGPNTINPVIISSAGNLGISTSNPTARLTVGTLGQFTVDGNGSMASTNAAPITFSASNPQFLANSVNSSSVELMQCSGAAAGGCNFRSTSANGTTDFLKFTGGNAGATEIMRMLGTGNVGIGTTKPFALLSVVGNVGIGTVKDGDLYISTAPPSGGIITEGNVGIGTFLPVKSLHIGGDMFLDRTTSTIWMREPDGTCGSCTLSNSEVFTCVSATCP